MFARHAAIAIVNAQRYEREFPEFDKNWGVTVEPLRDSMVRDVKTSLVVLLGAVGLLLAVACANLAGLTLARSLTRRHQVAIRLALGGSTRRVFWQLLIDGILLSAVALAGAVPLAWGIVRLVTASLSGVRGLARLISAARSASPPLRSGW